MVCGLFSMWSEVLNRAWPDISEIHRRCGDVTNKAEVMACAICKFEGLDLVLNS
jgi:hypothetical protein